MAGGLTMNSRTSPTRALALGAVGVSAALLLTACKTSASEYSVAPHEYSGVRLYQVYCSSCHGLSGRGDGPVEPLIRGGVPDLTRISARHGGTFPADRIREIVDGRAAFVAHGTRKMPVWGFEFHTGMSDSALARKRADQAVGRLVDHLETLQRDRDDH
jgi:mono/diheme cytochrome c family protein